MEITARSGVSFFNPPSSAQPCALHSIFDEVLRPQDVAHNAMIALAVKDDFRAAFNICRSERQGPLREEERRYLSNGLCLTCAVPSSSDLASTPTEFFAARRTSRAGSAFGRGHLSDRRARIIYANAAARSLGADGGALCLRTSTLSAHSALHSQRLAELIRAVLRGKPTASMSRASTRRWRAVDHPHVIRPRARYWPLRRHQYARRSRSAHHRRPREPCRRPYRLDHGCCWAHASGSQSGSCRVLRHNHPEHGQSTRPVAEHHQDALAQGIRQNWHQPSDGIGAALDCSSDSLTPTARPERT